MKTIILKIILLLPLNLQPKQVEDFLLTHNIKSRVEIIRLADNLELGTQLTYFNSLRKAFKYKKNQHIHVFTNPFLDPERIEYMLGYAAALDKISFTTWNNENSKGESRTIHSWQIFAHEIGHQLGLQHTRGCTDIMDEDLGRCLNIAELSFLPEQLRTINKRRKKRR